MNVTIQSCSISTLTTLNVKLNGMSLCDEMNFLLLMRKILSSQNQWWMMKLAAEGRPTARSKCYLQNFLPTN